MTDNAQNAFLLTLEEPPAYVLFLLLCDGTESLLETVKSRAPILRMEHLGESEVRSYMEKESAFLELSADEQRTVLISSGGCIGAALTMLDKKKRAPIIKRREAAQKFISACASGKGDEAVSAATSLGGKRDELLLCIEQVLLAIRDLMLVKKSENAPLLFYTDRETALSCADEFNLSRLMEISEGVQKISEMITRNANARLVAMKLMLCAIGERI
jgi:DNA polymerase-3 subunit delta'